MVAAFLRLGKKYNFAKLHEDALQRLIYEFPSTLEQRDANMPTAMIELTSTGDYFDIISLAREHNILSILPCAFFLCIIPEEDFLKTILHGYTREDGSTAKLCQDDQHKCLLGWQKIVKTQALTTYSWLDNATLYDGCSSSARCTPARKKLLLLERGTLPYCDAVFQPWKSSWGKSLCNFCGVAARSSHANGRKAAWNLLPSAFDLPSWEDLLKHTQ